MQGIHILDYSRKTDIFHRIAVVSIIAVTTLAMPANHEHCIAAGAKENLNKPLHLDKLVEAICKMYKKMQKQQSDFTICKLIFESPITENYQAFTKANTG